MSHTLILQSEKLAVGLLPEPETEYPFMSPRLCHQNKLRLIMKTNNVISPRLP